jgi:lysylphosphatidylglycerol synthetase-like protein (DUF2156 family)
MTARIFNVLIGTWLFVSSFAWPHTHGQHLAAMICGALTVLLSLGTTYFAGLRYFTAVIAVMLVVLTVASPHGWDRTSWHNVVIGVAIFIAALVDRGPAGVRRERELYGHT